MLVTEVQFRQLAAAEIFKVEKLPGSDGLSFDPLLEWVDDGGKRKPIGPQAKLGGVPIWTCSVRVPDLRYGTGIFRDESVYILSASKPDLTAEVDF